MMNIELEQSELNTLESVFLKAVDVLDSVVSSQNRKIDELEQLDAKKYRQRFRKELELEIAEWQEAIDQDVAKIKDIEALYKKLTGTDLDTVPF